MFDIVWDGIDQSYRGVVLYGHEKLYGHENVSLIYGVDVVNACLLNCKYTLKSCTADCVYVCVL